jgi:hypothetical protein
MILTLAKRARCRGMSVDSALACGRNRWLGHLGGQWWTGPTRCSRTGRGCMNGRTRRLVKIAGVEECGTLAGMRVTVTLVRFEVRASRSPRGPFGPYLGRYRKVGDILRPLSFPVSEMLEYLLIVWQPQRRWKPHKPKAAEWDESIWRALTKSVCRLRIWA